MLIPLGILAASGGQLKKYLAITHQQGVRIAAYPFDSGFGAKFANPAGIGGLTPSKAVDFSPTDIVIGGFYLPRVAAYPFDSGFGTKYADPSVSPTGETRKAAFTSSGDNVAIAHANVPYITAYPFASGFGTKYANPTTAIPETATGVAFTPQGDRVAVSYGRNPQVSAYPFASGFGTKFANPFNSPAGTQGIDVKLTQSLLATGNATNPGVALYPFTASGFGTKFANPSPLPAGSGNSIGMTDEDIIVGMNLAPFIHAYALSNGFNTKRADPTIAISSLRDIDFNGDNVAIALNDSPFIAAYPYASGFGTKYANPATLPNARGEGVALN